MNIKKRYVKQRDTFRCGPVAILNALKWLGKPCTYKKNIKRISELALCDKDYRGTNAADFDFVLRKMAPVKVDIKLIPFPTIPLIEEHLNMGGSIILNFVYIDRISNTRRGHYVFLVGMSTSRKSFKVINYSREKETTSIIKRYTLINHLKRRRRKGLMRPIAWFLPSPG